MTDQREPARNAPCPCGSGQRYGKPVIGTAYSGNLDFMHEGNSGLVDFAMVPVAAGEYIYDDPRFRWAEPDLDHAARQMQRMVADQAWREAIARRGMLELRSKFFRREYCGADLATPAATRCAVKH